MYGGLICKVVDKNKIARNEWFFHFDEKQEPYDMLCIICFLLLKLFLYV